MYFFENRKYKTSLKLEQFIDFSCKNLAYCNSIEITPEFCRKYLYFLFHPTVRNSGYTFFNFVCSYFLKLCLEPEKC